MDQNIFTLIKDNDEKLKLWQDLGSARGEILCKGNNEALCRVRAEFFNLKTRSLEAHFTEKIQLVEGEEYLGYFFIGGEKYYFQSTAGVLESSLVLPVPKEIYQLQRRQNYRLPIPATYPAILEVTERNQSALKLKCPLHDISSLGCRLLVDSHIKLDVSDTVKGLILISDRPGIEIQGVIRHKQTDPSNTSKQMIGVEFTPISKALENRLFALTMELHKKFFKSHL